MKCAVLLVALSSVFLCQAALPLPPYIKPCARSEPNFNECALEHAKDALPHIINGDKKYRIPPLDPLNVQEAVLTDGGTRAAAVRIVFKDVKVSGFKDTEIDKIEYDFDKQHYNHEITIPRLSAIGQYNVSGRILLLPISGNGDVNITIVNCKLIVGGEYTFRDIEGFRHMELQTPKTKTEMTRIYFNFTNLFNGNAALSKQMNAFLNENWSSVYNELSASVFFSWGQVILTLFSGFYSHVPFDVIFPENLPK